MKVYYGGWGQWGKYDAEGQFQLYGKQEAVKSIFQLLPDDELELNIKGVAEIGMLSPCDNSLPSIGALFMTQSYGDSWEWETVLYKKSNTSDDGILLPCNDKKPIEKGDDDLKRFEALKKLIIRWDLEYKFTRDNKERIIIPIAGDLLLKTLKNEYKTEFKDISLKKKNGTHQNMDGVSMWRIAERQEFCRLSSTVNRNKELTKKIINNR